MLEISLLVGCDIEWATGNAEQTELAQTDPPILRPGNVGDDGESSDASIEVLSSPALARC